jgi:hypothetical protein
MFKFMLRRRFERGVFAHLFCTGDFGRDSFSVGLLDPSSSLELE